MAGTKGKSGGSRPGSGRPTDKAVQQLRATLDEACPEITRQRIFKKLATEANKGNVNAAKVVLAYIYGTPPSGDDLLIQEGVNQFIHDSFPRLASHFGEEKAREIMGCIGTDAAAGGAGDSASGE